MRPAPPTADPIKPAPAGYAHRIARRNAFRREKPGPSKRPDDARTTSDGWPAAIRREAQAAMDDDEPGD